MKLQITKLRINRCLEDDGFCSKGATQTCAVHKTFAVLQGQIIDTLLDCTVDDQSIFCDIHRITCCSHHTAHLQLPFHLQNKRILRGIVLIQAIAEHQVPVCVCRSLPARWLPKPEALRKEAEPISDPPPVLCLSEQSLQRY